METSRECIERRTSAKLLWSTLGIALLLLMTVALGRLWNSRTRTSAVQRSSETPRSKVVAETRPAPLPTSTRAAASVETRRPSSSQPPQASSNLPASAPDPEVQARAAELMQLAMNDDTASLESILGELRNPNRAIRDAALQATIQFGSRDAIPSLNEAAQHTDDASEKNQILAAVEFLKLPSLSELILQRQALTALPSSVSSGAPADGKKE